MLAMSSRHHRRRTGSVRRTAGCHRPTMTDSDKGEQMRIVISDFMSLDGVVQAPGGAQEDTEGGFQHGGWSMPFFDEAAMGPYFDEAMQTTAALLYGRRTYQVM